MRKKLKNANIPTQSPCLCCGERIQKTIVPSIGIGCCQYLYFIL